MKKFYISTFNRDTGAISNLPKLYENREEAILAGQDYVKNRQHEDDSFLFFRIQYTETDSIPENWNLFDGMEDDDDDECDGNCDTCENFLICMGGN